MKTQAIRVVIADDHTGVRKGIRTLLEKAGDIVVVDEASDGAEAVALVDQHRPEVLLLDVEMPVMRGDEVARYIKQQGWDVNILAISTYDDRQYVSAMLEVGVAGYITKDEAPNMLIDAIRGVTQGQKGWVSKRVARQTGPLLPTRKTLSQREMHILYLIASGNSEKEISQTLDIPLDKLKEYLQLLMKKFFVENKNELLHIVRREELI